MWMNKQHRKIEISSLQQFYMNKALFVRVKTTLLAKT